MRRSPRIWGTFTGAACPASLLLLFGCTITEVDRAAGSERQALSEDASAFRELMRWDPLSDQEAVPTLDEQPAWPATDRPANLAAIDEAIAAIAGDDLESHRFSTETGAFLAESYERNIETGPDLSNEEVLLSGVRSVLDAAGAGADQLQLDVSTLRAVGGDRGDEPIKLDVAKTVHIGRKIGGVNVSLDGGTASFGMDGRFIRMSFQWRRLDYANSVLAVEGVDDRDDVMSLLAEGLAEQGVELRPSVEAIDVGTYYLATPAADPDSDLWTLHLIGYAGLRDSNGNGMGSEGSIPAYEFHLDGSGALIPGVD